MSCVDMAHPSPSVRAKVLFMHGDRDGTCPLSSARQAYREPPATKAFLPFRGAGPRWSPYGDTAARDRLRADATSSTTTWESILSRGATTPGPHPQHGRFAVPAASRTPAR
jgi:hypothetical protein